MAGDIYLSSSYVIDPVKGRICRADDDRKEQHDVLYKDLLATHERLASNSFSWDVEGARSRVSVIHSLGGIVFVIRKFPESVMALNSLRIPQFYCAELTQKQLTGLVLVAGKTHSGKTTTCAAVLLERLKLYGGIAITVEDPCELKLEGGHGDGMCYQIDAALHGGFASVLRDVVRMSPDVIFLGEIRDKDSAIEAVKAGTNGHLILATIHADDCIGALLRLRSFVSQSDLADVDQLISQGVGAVMHMKLEERLGVTTPDVEFISFMGESNNGYRMNIQNGKHQLLSTAVQSNKNEAKRSQKV
ncbi:ATPase, T2SS/T4P/T4SS family [Gulbenkiania mobilis]|uniref:ATPase, T2SS/T4P/T4SS family n=1 Tax=Gulbenkiania mobilis TaxID=397457 RepID=UPI0013791637|nr:ATPase, T2SS/T4P/T4SS family [Gulbenkiania mobilis]